MGKSNEIVKATLEKVSLNEIIETGKAFAKGSVSGDLQVFTQLYQYSILICKASIFRPTTKGVVVCDNMHSQA